MRRQTDPEVQQYRQWSLCTWQCPAWAVFFDLLPASTRVPPLDPMVLHLIHDSDRHPLTITDDVSLASLDACRFVRNVRFSGPEAPIDQAGIVAPRLRTVSFVNGHTYYPSFHFASLPRLRRLSANAAVTLDIAELASACKQLTCLEVIHGEWSSRAPLHTASIVDCTSLREVSIIHAPVSSMFLAELASVPRLDTLTLGDCSRALWDVSCLARSVTLTSLTIKDDSYMTDHGVSALNGCAALRHLNLSRCKRVTSVEALHIPMLETLILDGTGATSQGLEGLNRHSQLTSLSLSHCVRVCSLKALQGCDALLTVCLDFTTAELGTLCDVPALTAIHAANLHWHHYTPCTWSFPSLSTLLLSGSRTVEPVYKHNLHNATSLTCLDLSHCIVTSCKWALPCLRTLRLHQADGLNSVDGIETLPTLEELDLSCTGVSDIHCIAHLRCLRRLDLSQSEFNGSGLAGLAGIPTLTWLSLKRCTEIKSIAPLAPCRALRTLFVSGVTAADRSATCQALHLAETDVL